MKSFLFGLLWLCSMPLQAAEEITLFSYQHKPPYILDGHPPQGLYFDLAKKLGEHMPRYVFAIEEIPRARLDYLLVRNKLKGLVVGANPGWFADASRHHWTEPFIDDANVLVSRAEGSASRLSKADLPGHRVGLIGGHHYPALDDLIWSGKIIREDTTQEYENLERLLKGWIDATVVGERTMAFYLRRDAGLGSHLHIEGQPLSRYQRHILVPAQYADLLPELNLAIEQLKDDPSWRDSIERYR